MISIAEMGAEPIAQIWQELRALRSQKPGAAKKGDRLATFDAALEQAEQLFTAASVVGTATQPIILLYGLSQLGRAIAASSPLLSNNEYALSGHGIDDGRQLQGATSNGGLAKLMIRAEKNGAFPVVAKALGASPMVEPVPLGDIWALLPYSERFPLPYAGRLLRLDFMPARSFLGRVDEEEAGSLNLLPTHLQMDVEDPNCVPGEIIEEEWRRLREFLANYPTLSGWHTQGLLQRVPYIRGESDSYGSYLSISLAFKPREDDPRTPADQRAQIYHGARYVYPALDEGGRPAHPFMLWWAVLYPLSRLARYYPGVWMKLTSISSDPHAAPIEFILREAIRAVPELALRAISWSMIPHV
ncbi:YaaC family protein [Sinomonas terrae]|uniref:YaaC-like Protein n=1 Tax=Sinomonas terrae TaxID=2908838 RepID=A0ABS9U1Z3_9MICC|nr:hypothetical protein [Sinomonas terrae]MCH6470704.1 hypothetical protein [Sinomonas terrae]